MAWEITEVVAPPHDEAVGAAAEYVNIMPGVSILGVLGHLNYEPWYALAEYVDNALQSAAKSIVSIQRVESTYQLRVDISYEKEDGGRITITDNAGGIARRDFARAFRAAEIPTDRTGLSEFGMGMKSASIWFAQNWRVTTTSVNDPTLYSVEFDMQTVLANKVDRLKISTEPTERQDHYTRIELWNLNQLLAPRTLWKVREHLREIYRAFLADGRLALTVAGMPMHYVQPAILRASDYRAGKVEGITTEPQEWRKRISFTFEDGLHVVGWAAIRAEGKTNGNGLSLFRRGRVIMGTGDTPYRPAGIYGQGNSYRSQRLFGELALEGLPVSHTKDGFQWQGREDEFEAKLRESLDAEPLPLLKQAEHYRARETSRIEQGRIRTAMVNTVEAVQAAFPTALNELSEDVPDVLPAVATGNDSATATNEESREFSFIHRSTTWNVSITAASRLAEPRWLIRHSDLDPATDTITVTIILNTAHKFLKQFALGSTDAIEATLRVAVALVVSEAMSRSSGDGEAAASFMRQVDSLLASALADRVGGSRD